jgi:predicted branched-subunit amino acid permease
MADWGMSPSGAADDTTSPRAAGQGPDLGSTTGPERIVLRAVTVGVAVAAFGVAFGVTAVAAGMSPLLATLMSAAVFAGASQFAFVAVATVSDPFTGALSGILLNLRLIAFGYALAPRLTPAPLRVRLLDGFLLTDESAALAFDGPPAGARRRLWVAGTSVGLFWVGSTALGAYGGDLIGDVAVYGLDVAFPAAFIALLAPGLRQQHGLRVALGGAIIAGVSVLTLPAGFAVFLSGLAVLPFIFRVPPTTSALGARTPAASGHVAGDATGDVGGPVPPVASTGPADQDPTR